MCMPISEIRKEKVMRCSTCGYIQRPVAFILLVLDFNGY